MKIRIGRLSVFFHTAILPMAQGKADERIGAEIEWRLMGTGPAIMKAFRQDELDLAYMRQKTSTMTSGFVPGRINLT